MGRKHKHSSAAAAADSAGAIAAETTSRGGAFSPSAGAHNGRSGNLRMPCEFLELPIAKKVVPDWPLIRISQWYGYNVNVDVSPAVTPCSKCQSSALGARELAKSVIRGYCDNGGPIAKSFVEILLNLLDEMLSSGRRIIVSHGYSDEVALRALVHLGFLYGFWMPNSCIVDDALIVIRSGVAMADDYKTEELEDALKEMEMFVIAEAVALLCYLVDAFTVADALWCYLACGMDATIVITHGIAMLTPEDKSPVHFSAQFSCETISLMQGMAFGVCQLDPVENLAYYTQMERKGVMYVPEVWMEQTWKKGSPLANVAWASCSGQTSKPATPNAMVLRGRSSYKTSDGPVKKEDVSAKLTKQLDDLRQELRCWTSYASYMLAQSTKWIAKEKIEMQLLQELDDKEKNLGEKLDEKIRAERNKEAKDNNDKCVQLTAAIHSLGDANSNLKVEMQTIKTQQEESAARHCELLKKPCILPMLQSLEEEKIVLQDELADANGKLSRLQLLVKQARGHLTELAVESGHLEVATGEILALANAERQECSSINTSAESCIKTLLGQAEKEAERFQDDINCLYEQISFYHTLTEPPKVKKLEALVDERCAPGIPESTDIGSDHIERGWECVMCLSEETSVVFLPCAHSVLCRRCDELHEKQGMENCPCCRSPVRRRVPIRPTHC